MRLRTAGENGEKEGQDQKPENAQEEEIELSARKRSPREGARSTSIAAPSCCLYSSYPPNIRLRRDYLDPLSILKSVADSCGAQSVRVIHWHCLSIVTYLNT